ncbi:MAG: FlgD immunoglobulin-like domain containing protein [Armatimonadota bacterium]
MKLFGIVEDISRRWIACVVAVGLLVCILPAGGHAQPSNDFRAVYLNNGILFTGVGLDGQVGIGGTNYDAIGRITLGTVQGARFTTDDDNKPLIYAYPYPAGNFGVVTVRIVTAEETQDLIWGSDDGEWVDGIEPFADRGGRHMIVGRWRHPDTGIRVDMVLQLVGAYARITWTITNEGVDTAQVGLRFLIDEEVGSGFNVTTPDYVLVPGYFPVQNDLDLQGRQVPSYVDAAPRRTMTAPILRWLFKLFKQTDLTTPDRVVISQFSRLSANLWDFTSLPQAEVTDHAIACYWNTQPLPPGKPRTIVTMIGLATSSNDPVGRYALDTESPGVVGLDARATNQLSPEEFTISASVTNYLSLNALQNVTFEDVSFAISLPKGLALADGESFTKTVPSILPGEIATVSWRVKPTGERVGELTYRVYSTVSPGSLSKGVSRSLIVPMTAKVDLKTGFQMVSLPFAFDNADPAVVLGLDPGEFILLRWDTAQRRYAQVNSVRPGEGYWLRVNTDQTLTLNGAKVAGDAFGGTLRLSLPQGWVQIGNPYPYPVPIGLIRFVDTKAGTAITFAEAVERGVVRSVLFYYDATPPAGYRSISLLSDPSAPMMPGRGYWIYVDSRDLEIIFPNVVAPGATISFPSRLSVAPVRWQVQFSAQCDGKADQSTVIGAASRAADGIDMFDMPKPPAPVEESVRTLLIAPDGQSALAQDIRADATRRQVWEMVVIAPKPDSTVVLRWNGMQGVPSTIRLKLVDTEAKVTRDMRSISSYTFTVGAAGSRRFQIVAEPRGAAGLRITSLRVSRTRGGAVAISYTLSDTASTKVRILSATGQIVQTLQAGEAASRGVTNLTWNGRDGTGIAVPAGTYLVEVTATAEDGQAARAVQPVVITR